MLEARWGIAPFLYHEASHPGAASTWMSLTPTKLLSPGPTTPLQIATSRRLIKGRHKLVVLYPQNRRDELPALSSLSPSGCDNTRHLCLFSSSKRLPEETSRARIDVISAGCVPRLIPICAHPLHKTTGNEGDLRYQNEVGDTEFEWMRKYGTAWHRSGPLGVRLLESNMKPHYLTPEGARR